VKTLKFTSWKESDGKFLGFLNDFPDHWTQGENMGDLKEHLKDLYELFSSDDIPGIRQVQELEIEVA
jgi:predicted RNase H-like HicB family nuclease